MKATVAITIFAILCLLTSIGLAPKVIAQQSVANWPMFQADPSHSGEGKGNPVLAPTLLWNFTTTNGVWSSPAVVNGAVYVGSENIFYKGVQHGYVGNFYALNAKNGAKIWNYTTADGDSSPALVGGIVYLGSWNDNVYALNAANGAEIWSYPTGNIVDSSPTVVNEVVT